MFDQMGLLEEANSYSNWIHDYRENIYYKSDRFKEGMNLFLKNSESFNVVKIVTNPFKRAAMSYVHANVHGYEDKKISKYLKREVSSKKRFSFREFSQYINNININKCNIHHKVQTSKAERTGLVKSIHVIDLQESMLKIPELEKSLDLKNVDLEKIRKSPHHREKRKTPEFMGDSKMNDLYKRHQPILPEYIQFYDQEIKEMISHAYKEDFDRYNYSVNELNF